MLIFTYTNLLFLLPSHIKYPYGAPVPAKQVTEPIGVAKFNKFGPPYTLKFGKFLFIS
jgi:hypothetical protein